MLGLEVDAGQAGELPELQVEDVLGLRRRRTRTAPRMSPTRAVGAVLGAADQGDDLVDDVDGLEQALDDVRLGAAPSRGGTPTGGG